LAEIPPEALTLGLARIARSAFEQGELQPLFDRLAARLDANPRDAAAMIDLASVLETDGHAEPATSLRQDALKLRRSFATVHGDGSGPRILALITAGGFMANTPVDFLLEGSNAVLWQHHVDETTESLEDVPDHDAAVLAIGEAPEQQATLARLGKLLPALPGPVLNGAPDRIAALTRDGVARRLAGLPGLLAPAAVRAGRAELAPIAAGAPLDTLGPGLAWPLIARPLGSHAGKGMEKLLDAGHLADLLAETETEAFYLVPFIDYRGPHGLYAKARVVLIGGKPYPVHLALSEDWIVHYLSAGMAESPARRAVEAAWFANFDDGFARRHAATFAALQDRIGLDYWGLDCAELADGRLLVFEVDTALIVHDMDDPATFPYKRAPMRRLFAAFRQHFFSISPRGRNSAGFYLQTELIRATLPPRH
jgi:hypothetical protein